MATLYERQQSIVDQLGRQWIDGIRLAAAVGAAYFLAAQLSLGLLMKPDGVAVFWPAAGISSGVLIALGPRARWPVAAGAMVATVAANLMGDRNLWAAVAFAVCNAAEALITAGLIQHYFGARIGLDRLRHVLGLLVAAVAGTAISGIGGALGYKLFHSPTVSMLTTWRHWFASDVVGIIAVAPLVIGLAAAARDRPPRGELVEGTVALLILAAMTAVIISLPQEPWQTVVPGALLFPTLLWLAARCRPLFAASGAFLVSLTVVWTAILGIGHFGDVALPIDDRILQAQAVILVVALGASVLAALFAERRENEARLAHSNMMLERERDNKLMNVEAITVAIAHEVRQPLAAIVANGNAALRFLDKEPPDRDEVRSALNRIVNDGHRTSEVFDGIRALFRKVDQGRQPVDINKLILGVLQSLQGEFKDRVIELRSELAAELPLIDGHAGQLQEVIINLVRNAIEAMENVADRDRVLQVTTGLRDRESVAVAVRDSGPGIDPKQLDEIFNAFFTTKSQGTGLGLAICRMIIEHHGGQLVASSDGKSGALFQFVLPIESADMVTITRI
ncbi:MAG TPA: MASE1 domain-containing protein [Xanthobacteraceae bacterium]|nr:MASE1 domain-containing protein [Xanthobacteraceae bacterium]